MQDHTEGSIAMKYKIYRMNFNTGLHIGNGFVSDNMEIIQADTLFSALCHMAAQWGGTQAVEQMVSWVKKGELLFSDALPYIGDSFYLPKPIVRFESSQDHDSRIKKMLKNMPFIPLDRFEDFINGRMEIEAEKECLNGLGRKVLSAHACVTGEDDTTPYSVGSYHFNSGNGLYFCLAYKEESICEVVEEYLEYLELDGIGGRRSSGLGKFTVRREKGMPAELQKRLENAGNAKTKMSLSISMAADDELEAALEGAFYVLQKRGGFIDSPVYTGKPLKKKDFYCFKSGSCFCHVFKGDVFDVSEFGPHSVYRYGKPLFMEV